MKFYNKKRYSILEIFIISLLLINCNSLNKDVFTIRGIIVNNPNNISKIYLLHWERDSSFVDSSLITNGVFQFSLPLNKNQAPFLACFAPDKDNLWAETTSSFYIEPSNAEISLDLDNMVTTYCPATTTLQKEFNIWSDKVGSNYTRITKLLDKKEDSTITGYERIIIQQKVDSLQNESITQNILFIRQYPQSYITLNKLPYIWHWGNEDIKALVDSIFIQMPLKMKQSDAGLEIEGLIEGRRISAIGQPAPDFTVLDINGNNISLKSFKGNYLLIDFWASWCKPCRDDIPFVKQIYEKYHSKGLDILAVSIDEKDYQWKKAIEEDKTVWLHAIEPFRSKNSRESIVRNYYVQGIPCKVLINKEGIIIGRWIGGGEENEKEIEELLQNSLHN